MDFKHLLQSAVLTLFISGCGGGGDTAEPIPKITIKITVADLPEQIPVSNYRIGIPSLYWQVIFDVNIDGVVNQGDVFLDFVNYPHTVFNNELPLTAAIGELESNVTMSNESGSVTRGALLDLEQVGNTIIITLQHEYISKNITLDTPVYFVTRGNYSDGVSTFDYYPALNTFAKITEDGKFVDASDDVVEPVFQPINMVSMEVLIE